MSKNSQKQLYTQFMEWMGTRGKQRKKRVKADNKTRLEYYESKNV